MYHGQQRKAGTGQLDAGRNASGHLYLADRTHHGPCAGGVGSAPQIYLAPVQPFQLALKQVELAAGNDVRALSWDSPCILDKAAGMLARAVVSWETVPSAPLNKDGAD
ncbi:hypothetical protein [Xanthobacter versatilis]|uniref:hypothetical protein n=1 Tax=Xanthobacter autotrophicus (strain ATCC BAA-1158 / Py2) TaxID=78245 RepID=UPI003728B49D